MGFWFHGLLGLASFLSILNQIAGTVPWYKSVKKYVGTDRVKNEHIFLTCHQSIMELWTWR